MSQRSGRKRKRRVTKYQTEADCINQIATLRNDILATALKHKKELHEEVDHPGLSEISEVFDMRLWDFGLEGKIQTEQRLEEFIHGQYDNMNIGEDFLIGTNVERKEISSRIAKV